MDAMNHILFLLCNHHHLHLWRQWDGRKNCSAGSILYISLTVLALMMMVCPAHTKRDNEKEHKQWDIWNQRRAVLWLWLFVVSLFSRYSSCLTFIFLLALIYSFIMILLCIFYREMYYYTEEERDVVSIMYFLLKTYHISHHPAKKRIKKSILFYRRRRFKYMT